MLHLLGGFDAIIWIFGVLKTGAAYTVMDPHHPIDRKRAIFQLSKAEVCVFGEIHAESLRGIIQESLVRSCTTTTNPAIDMYPTFPVEDEECAPDDLAYIIFTSGSTGTPKGIMVEHRQFSHFVSGARTLIPIGTSTRVLQVVSFSFDVIIVEFATTLSFGGTLCFAERREHLVGDYLADVIEVNEVRISDPLDSSSQIYSAMFAGQCFHYHTISSRFVAAESQSSNLEIYLRRG